MGVPPIEQTRAALLSAWYEHDIAAETSLEEERKLGRRAHPTPRGRLGDTARALEVAFGDHAVHFGLGTTPFRDLCASYRRARFTREQALTALEAGILATR
jgi:hypothetical protein